MSNLFLKLIKFGIGFVLFIPLYINGSFFFPFIFPKIWLFQLVVQIISPFYIVLAISEAKYRPRFNWILKSVAILTLILIVTSLTGVDAYRSFWGNTERMSGVISWLHFVAFAVIFSGIVKNNKDWRNFFGIAVFVSVLEFFYVLAQYFNASWVWMPGNQFGTIGNTDLLGTYAIFGAFFAAYLWREGGGDSSKFKWLWPLAFFMNVGTLIIASSRGAILGFAFGVLIYLALEGRKGKINFKILIVPALILLLSYSVIFLARDSNFVKNNRQLSRLTHFSLKDDTVQQRFTEWGIAWNAFMARPVFGFGPNNYLYLHNMFLNPRVYQLRETNFDRAHNAYLDYASMSGILGLLGYVFLIWVLFWTFYKNNFRTMAALIGAYALQSISVFDSPASYIMLFATIGFAMFAESGSERQEVNGRQPMVFSPQTALALSVACFLLLTFIFWQVSIKPAVANYKFVRAFQSADFELYKESLNYETLGTTEFRNQYIQWLQKNLGNFKPEEKLAVLDFGISELEKEVKSHPLVFSFLNLGQLYGYRARGFQDESVRKEFFEKAADAYEKALELSPKRLEVYYSYLQITFDSKNYQKGIDLMKHAVSNAPDYWQTHWYLGIAYTASGNDAEAVKALNDSLVLFYNPITVNSENGRLKYNFSQVSNFAVGFAPKQEILGAVNPYIRLKMWPELLLLYLSVAKADPNDVGIHQSLALVYQNLGMHDRAEEELKIIENLNKK